MFEEHKDKAKQTTGEKGKRVDEITALLAEEIIPKPDILRAESPAFAQYQIASAELQHVACVLHAYEWTDHRAKVARKAAQIAQRERKVGQAWREKERATREVSVEEKNRAHL